MVKDIKTRYWQVGDQGPAIILIHGFGAAVEYWLLNINELAKKHRVYALDLVGFGCSDKPKINYTGESFAKFIRDFMLTQQLDKAVIVGHSLGGAVALHFALEYKNMVEKLILVSNGGFGKKISFKLRILTLPIIGDIIMHSLTKATFGMSMRSFVYNKITVSKKLIDFLYPLFKLPGIRGSLLAILRGHANIFGVRPKAIQAIFDKLQLIDAPTLIIWGKQDSVLPVEYAHIGAQKLVNAKLHIFDNCGHIPQIEYPEKFNKLINTFNLP